MDALLGISGLSELRQDCRSVRAVLMCHFNVSLFVNVEADLYRISNAFLFGLTASFSLIRSLRCVIS